MPHHRKTETHDHHSYNHIPHVVQHHIIIKNHKENSVHPIKHIIINGNKHTPQHTLITHHSVNYSLYRM